MQYKDLGFSKLPKEKSTYVDMARKCRELGARSPKISDQELRWTIAYSLANQHGTSVDRVFSSPKIGGDKTLYSLLSTCSGIARPSGENSEYKASLVDRALQEPRPSWSRIVAASRGRLPAKK